MDFFWAFYIYSGENWLGFFTEGPAIGLLGDPIYGVKADVVGTQDISNIYGVLRANFGLI